MTHDDLAVIKIVLPKETGQLQAFLTHSFEGAENEKKTSFVSYAALGIFARFMDPNHLGAEF